MLKCAKFTSQIIERARQTHLFEKFRTEVQTHSQELLTQVEDAWKQHVRGKVSKGLPESERVVEGQEETAWSRLTELAQDKSWKQECLKRDEKFDMYFSSAVRYFYTPL